MSPPPVFVVKDLRVDAGRRTVMRGTTDVPLPKLSFDLFLMLLESAPNVVSTDQFMDKVWKGLVVSPETVGQRVRLLREAIGDDARNPSYIAGVRGLGYRLIAPVIREAPPSENVPIAPAAADVPMPERDKEPAETPSAGGAVPIGVLAVRSARTRRMLTAAAAAALVALSVGVYLLVGRSPPASVTVVGAPYSAVAVIPFASISAGHQDDYIATGLSEMILNRLAGISTLRVVARTSAQAAREQNFSLEDVRQKLHAQFLVDGTLQRAGEQMRVTAQVTDTETGRQVTVIHVDKPLSALFDLQDELADRVATALAVRMGDTGFKPEQARNAATAAYLEYLQGRGLMAHFTVGSANRAAAHFTKAIEIDPTFAAAYAGLAMAMDWQLLGRDPKLVDQSRLRELQLVNRALSLDDTLGEAYATRAMIQPDGHDKANEADFLRSIQLSPSYSFAYILYAEQLYFWGRPREAEAMLDRAQLIDPLQPRIPYVKAMNIVMGDDEKQVNDIPRARKDATTLMEQALQFDPQYTNALARLGQWQAIWYGHFSDAVRLVERALQSDPDASWLRETLAYMYLGAGDPEGLRGLIRSSHDSAWLPRLLLALYSGDWQTAAELEFDRPGDGPARLSRGQVFAMQIWAQHTKDYARASAHIREITAIKPGHEFDSDNFDAGMSLAVLAKVSGDQASVPTLASRALASLDKVSDDSEDFDSWMPPLANRACAHLLLGQNSEALDELVRSTHSKAQYVLPFAWMLKQNALFDPIRNDPRFQSVVEKVDADIAVQHRLLEALRAKGEIPTRAREGSPP